MPHHHREKYHDWWYDDIPDGCKQAASVMGYDDKAHWDEDKPVNYDDAKFTDLSLQEKRAAWHLGWNVIDDKLDIWWEDTDEETKAAARAVGWTRETWDGDWRIQDLPIEHKYWEQLTDDERAGATHFGYTVITWDETGATEWEDDGAPAPKLNIPPPSEEEKKEEEEEETDEEEEEAEKAEEAEATEAEAPKKKKKKKLRFVLSKPFGGNGGGEFDDKNHRTVKKIVVNSGAIVDSITMTYESGEADKHGGGGGGETAFALESGEFVNAVTIKASNVVMCMTFHTNTGRDLGPCGGNGRMLDKKAEEEKVVAPNGLGLCGIKGTSGKALDSIAFRWGTVRK